MTPFLRKLLGLNWLLLANMLALSIFGIIAIYSATYMRQDPNVAEYGANKQTGSRSVFSPSLSSA